MHKFAKILKNQKIAKKLRLRAEATEAELEQAIEEVVEETETLEEKVEELEQKLEALEETVDGSGSGVSNETDKDAQIAALQAQIEELQKQLDELLAAEEAESAAEATAKARAGKIARLELKRVTARMTELETKLETRDREAIVATLRREKKLTPAMEKEVVAQMSLAQLQAFAKVAPRLTAESFTKPAASSALTTPDGRKWADLKPAMRAQLKSEHPELYEAMRAQASC